MDDSSWVNIQSMLSDEYPHTKRSPELSRVSSPSLSRLSSSPSKKEAEEICAETFHLQFPSLLLHAPQEKSIAHWQYPKPGLLIMTAYGILFQPKKDDSDSSDSAPTQRTSTNRSHEMLEIFFTNIAELKECHYSSSAYHQYELSITCKSFQAYRFGFESILNGKDFIQNLHLVVAQVPLPFAFRYMTIPSSTTGTSSSLTTYPSADVTLQEDYHRLFQKIAPKSNCWRMSRGNEHYAISKTYPKYYCVPAHVSEATIRASAGFRKNQRLPVLSYLHSNGTSMSRCAQPLVGLRQHRSSADEELFRAIRDTSPSGRLKIMDCRSQASAYGNFALGGGFEQSSNYDHVDIAFFGIENIHAMRDSYRKIHDLIQLGHSVGLDHRSSTSSSSSTSSTCRCPSTTSNRNPSSHHPHWFSKLDNTRWLEHVKSLLVATSTCVELLDQHETSLVIHCTDGWDRTSQLLSLVKVCLDPHYRTMSGFVSLLEIDWCAFGHCFGTRLGTLSSSLMHKSYWDENECSPVFPQFMDAMYQLVTNFPLSFEFTSDFLIAILDEVYSNRFGTFLYDSCYTRQVVYQVERKTKSLWPTLLAGDTHNDKGHYLNPFYVPHDDTKQNEDKILYCSWHYSQLSFWKQYYLRSVSFYPSPSRWNPPPHDASHQNELMVVMHEDEKRTQWAVAMKAQKLVLEKELATLRETHAEQATHFQLMQKELEYVKEQATNPALRGKNDRRRQLSRRLKNHVKDCHSLKDDLTIIIEQQVTEEDSDAILLSTAPAQRTVPASAFMMVVPSSTGEIHEDYFIRPP